MVFELDEFADLKAKMKVVGVGGAGGNAINGMIAAQLSGVDFIAINTDAQALEANQSPRKIQIGKDLTKGLGVGSNPELGRKAMEEDKDQVVSALTDADMVFVTAGFGGGTGTGAAPIIAEVAKDLGALTVAIVTTPFHFEGKRRMEKAEAGIREIKDRVDTLIIIPNQRLLSVVSKETSLIDSFKVADSVLLQATQGISDLITIPGMINLDFADVRTVMAEMGDALMGVGVANGENRAMEAAHQAISSPLLEDVSIAGARGLLINITGGVDMTLYDVNDATSVIYEAAGDEANVIFGAVIDESIKDEIRVTVIATGFNDSSKRRRLVSEDRFVDFQGQNLQPYERPAYLRKEEFGEVKEYVHPDEEPQPDVDADNLDIPTFLRKQMD
ncbi:cell division protein FtsZ [candidate division KSB1 bacterium]|nr:cell division protein FtsZ [candidate division KSB1 bacterium]